MGADPALCKPIYNGPMVLVRNTFLDIQLDASDFDDDASGPPAPAGDCLKRFETAPAAPAHRGTPGELTDAAASGAVGAEAEAEGDDEDPEEAPEPHGLCRTTTVNWVEDLQGWQWAYDDYTEPMPPLPPALDSIDQAGLLTHQVPMGCGSPVQMQPMAGLCQGMVPIVPVCPGLGMPMVPMMPVLVPIGFDGLALPQDLQPRQPDRSMRWPSPPTEASSSELGAAELSPGTSPAQGSDATKLADAFVVDEMVPQANPLSRYQSVSSGNERIYWTVDARKLKSNDKEAVSPSFELYFGSEFDKVIFKMMVKPKVVSDSKGGASFRKAKGRGFVQLKCETDLLSGEADPSGEAHPSGEAAAHASWRISIGAQEPRGPVHHNFASSAVSRLPRELEEWDFNEALSPSAGSFQTFVVCLEIKPSLR